MPCFTIGLDLGQTRDPSVLAIVERVEATTGYMRRNVFGDEREALTDHHFVRYLQRFEIGTSYTKVVEEVGRLLDTAELRGCTTLRFDATGVARAVADMFKDA